MEKSLSNYSQGERLLAKSLENFPRLRTLVKESYKRVIYFRHRQNGFQYKLHPKVNLQSVFEWAGMEAPRQEYFYGYYDKSPWSPVSNRFLLHFWNNQSLQILALDPAEDAPLFLGETNCWNWQQGAMAHWAIIDGQDWIIYNIIQNHNLGMRIVRPDLSEERFLPWPIQTLNPQKPEALSINYRRLFVIRECYGYAKPVANFSYDMDYDKDGIWRINLKTGKEELIISLEQLRNMHVVPAMKDAVHKVNHLIYSPTGEQIVFLHRYYTQQGRFSRLYTVKNDGSQINLLLNERMISHYHWLDEKHVIAWARTSKSGDRYYKINIESGVKYIVCENILEKFGDGHCSVSPNRRYLLTDTYPDKARNQHLLIFDLKTHQCHKVGTFFSPWKYYEDNRCDLHPRWSPDGNFVSLDSAHNGFRQSYVIHVKNLLESCG